MKKIFLLHAHAQSGKDTCASMMKEFLESKNQRVITIAFADYVKFALEKYYQITNYKSVEGRTKIQHFATDQVRKFDATFWAKTVAILLKAIEDDFDVAIITDWRFYNEYYITKNYFSEQQVIPVLITRPENEKTDNMTDAQRKHQSESELDNCNFFVYNIINEYGKLDSTKQQLIKMIEKEVGNEY